MIDRLPRHLHLRKHNALQAVAGLICMLLLAPVAQADSLALVDVDIMFAGKNDMRLSKDGKQSLQDLTRTLQGLSGILSIRIIGHTDDVGEEEINRHVSRQRADWMKRHFRTRFPKAHIMALAAGESIPFASNLNDVGRARNQRVQIQVIATGIVPGGD